MDARTWQAAKSLLIEAASLPRGGQQAFLEERCGDPKVRAELAAMLAAPVNLSDVLAAPVLAPGTSLGSYVIDGLLGAGGMGEVYKAKDTRLDRTVAIKVLPSSLADPEHRARFEREARTIASLAHPHICTLHDVGEYESALFLVMEYLDGQTLADRLKKGALPIEQALEFGAQIAEALAAAHRHGIIHRDLKPANIMLTESGVKLLDFGLAKLASHAEAIPGVDAITESRPLTAQWTIVGTLQYMAPEQLEGRDVDVRSDLFAFGAVLYEMLTGRRAFEGGSPASISAAIVSSDPPTIAAIPSPISVALDRTVRRCLAKDPQRRWQNAADLADELSWITQLERTATPAFVGKRQPIPSAALLFIVAALAALAAVAVLWGTSRQPTTMLPSHLSISIAADNLTLTDGGLAISPDGSTLVFAARGRDDDARLYTRRLDSWESRPLKGTEGAVAPFFSFDGSSVGFVADGALKRILLREGTPQTICQLGYQGISHGYWGADDRILATRWPGGLVSIPAAGGGPDPLVAPAPSLRYLWPQLLPDGKTVMLTIVERGHPRVAALPASTTVWRTLIDSATAPRYLPTGHLVYESDGHLMAAPFDPKQLKTLAPPQVVADDVAVGQARASIAYGYDVSTTGTLVYLSAAATKNVLVWKDRTGREVPLPLNAREYAFPSLSRDGRRLTVTVARGLRTNVWVGSVDREPLNQLTSTPSSMCSLFSPDGKWVVFTSSTDNGWFNLFKTASNGTGQPERVLESPLHQKPASFVPSSLTLLFNEANASGDRDISAIDIDRQAPSRSFLKTAANELEATVSPDGQWVAYQSDETGQWEIYLRPYIHGGGRQRVSTSGGMAPVWNPKGRELFYQTRTALMAVRIVDGQVLDVPSKLFAVRKSEDYRREFDVSPDGDHFLFMEPASSRTVINVITNWFDELRAKAPVK